MKYTYQRTHDFEVALNWVICCQHKDNVSFRFTFETYRGDYCTPWMSPSQCLTYMRFTSSDFEFKNFTMRLCA